MFAFVVPSSLRGVYQILGQQTAGANRNTRHATRFVQPAISGWWSMNASSLSGGDTLVAQVEQKLRNALKPTSLRVVPAYGDPNGSHVA
mmetsp:Transcript_16582/g.33969  ORF Transcript_16582/g.33969 Transcript_16582/m.33969 type:complete len:89 (-) Transcript_16582:625-891(-)